VTPVDAVAGVVVDALGDGRVDCVVVAAVVEDVRGPELVVAV
jgi:hypothetical protein